MSALSGVNKREVLEKAIQKAESNGWQRPRYLIFENGKGDFYFPTGDVSTTFAIRTLLLDRDFAKALWGKHSSVEYHLHDCHIDDKDYVDDTPVPNTYDQRLEHYKKDYTCRRCGKYLKMKHTINSTHCLKVEGTSYNLGWEHHLANMVIADDPIAYLGENL